MVFLYHAQVRWGASFFEAASSDKSNSQARYHASYDHKRQGATSLFSDFDLASGFMLACTKPIARIWHVRTPATKSEKYTQYLYTTGSKLSGRFCRSAPECRMHPDDAGVYCLLLLSYWLALARCRRQTRSCRTAIWKYIAGYTGIHDHTLLLYFAAEHQTAHCEQG